MTPRIKINITEMSRIQITSLKVGKPSQDTRICDSIFKDSSRYCDYQSPNGIFR